MQHEELIELGRKPRNEGAAYEETAGSFCAHRITFSFKKEIGRFENRKSAAEIYHQKKKAAARQGE